MSILHPSVYECVVDSMFIAIHFFSFHVYVKALPSCSHTMLISLTSSFPTPFNVSSACLISLSSFPNILPIFSLTLRFLRCCPMFFSLCPCLLLLLYVSQSRIPGTVIPLCAAQCERIFSTTRTPGEETGKATRHVHTRRYCYDEAFNTVLI